MEFPTAAEIAAGHYTSVLADQVMAGCQPAASCVCISALETCCAAGWFLQPEALVGVAVKGGAAT